MNKVFEAYLKALNSGILEELLPDYTGDFKTDKIHFKKAWIKRKQIDPRFQLLK